MSTSDLPAEESDLSLVSGGPIYRRLEKIGIARAGLTGLKIRLILCVLITWVPIVVLCWWQGRQSSAPLLQGFLSNFLESIRFLVIMPLLVFAELPIKPWVTHVVRYFVKSGLIPDEQLSSYSKIIERAKKMRDSLVVEVVILGVAFYTSTFHVTITANSEHADWQFIDGHSTMACMWFRYISMPFFRFICLSWYWRIVVWCFALIRISMLKLKLVSTHPDCRGGLGFLASGHNNFAILPFALSCFISAVLGEEIVYHGQSVDELKGTIVLTIIAITFLSILPLIFFTPKLIERRRLGLYQYGILAKQYVDRYHSKWVRDEQQAGEGLSAESVEMDPKAQDNFKAVGSMQVTVFDKNSIIAFAIAAAVPFAPLFLTIYKFDQLVDHILKKLF